MSKKERIKKLEREVAELRARIVALENGSIWWAAPPVPKAPYRVTCGTSIGNYL